MGFFYEVKRELGVYRFASLRVCVSCSLADRCSRPSARVFTHKLKTYRNRRSGSSREEQEGHIVTDNED
jgi:hypothetical protein